jgi:Flp pilus assembly protein TadG
MRLNFPRFRVTIVRRFKKAEDGTTAIEFAVVAMPFFAMMFAIIETSLSFFASQLLETAVGDAARMVMTGQAKNFDAVTFKTQVCNRIPSIIDCAGGVKVDVRPYDEFSAADMSKPLVGGNVVFPPGFPTFDPGVGGQIIVVRATYEMPVYTNFYGKGVANTNNQKLLIMATSAFRNEPF